MRIIIPKSSNQLLAGRERLSKEFQALCFLSLRKFSIIRIKPFGNIKSTDWER